MLLFYIYIFIYQFYFIQYNLSKKFINSYKDNLINTKF